VIKAGIKASVFFGLALRAPFAAQAAVERKYSGLPIPTGTA
jgi:hypothetical protein